MFCADEDHEDDELPCIPHVRCVFVEEAAHHLLFASAPIAPSKPRMFRLQGIMAGIMAGGCSIVSVSLAVVIIVVSI